jgi:carboxymethylenebutenolidase
VVNRSRPAPRVEFSVEPEGARDCVVVFHEVWGLVGHTEDICKRLGKLGFAATAPNLYANHRDVLTPGNIQEAMEGLWELSLEERRDKEKVARALDRKGVSKEARGVASIIYEPGFRDRMLADAMAAVERAHSRFDRVTTLGFCLGGGLSLKCATGSRHLVSAISFYGQPPPNEDVASISIPILDIHAYQDELINKSVPAFVGAMIDGGKDLTLKTYPQTKHGFFNDARKEVYDRDAAGDAWDITRWFLERTLGRH